MIGLVILCLLGMLWCMFFSALVMHHSILGALGFAGMGLGFLVAIISIPVGIIIGLLGFVILTIAGELAFE